MEKDSIRMMSKNFQGIGRRFVKGDIICFINGNMFHIYPDKEEIDHLKDDISDIDQKEISEILENSVNI